MLAEYPSQGNLKGINKLKMKEKIIEELRNKFFMDCTNMNDETPKVHVIDFGHNAFVQLG